MFRQKFLYQLPQGLGIRKISVNGIRAKKNPHSKENIFWIFMELCGSKVKISEYLLSRTPMDGCFWQSHVQSKKQKRQINAFNRHGHSENDVNGHFFFFDEHSFFFSLRRYVLFLTRDLYLSAAAQDCSSIVFSPILGQSSIFIPPESVRKPKVF